MLLKRIISRILIWRLRNISDKRFLIGLSILIGLLVGLAAALLKYSVHYIRWLLTLSFEEDLGNYLYLVYPVLGILIVIFFIRYLLKKEVKAEIGSILYAILRRKGKIDSHQSYGVLAASALTVGFGGSVGLEGPSVTMGAAMGSTLGQWFRLNHKQLILLIGCASAGAISALFKAPVAGVVFALEVIMLDLTMSSVIPLLFASVTGALTSYLLFGADVIYNVKITESFEFFQIPYFILLGIFAGLFSVYFRNIHFFTQSQFERIKSWPIRLLVGGVILGTLIYFIPALYGEGYDTVNSCLKGDYGFLFERSPFFEYKDNITAILLMFLALVILKSIATAVTFGAGGVGGIFAPSLFLGASIGFLFAKTINLTGVKLPESNFALVGMAGLISGVIYAPLTGIFLIAELTNGYELILPLILVSSIAYATSRLIHTYSIYTYPLAKSGDLLTHDKDKAVLSMMSIEQLIETNFKTVKPNDTLRELTNAISRSSRNLYPVVDDENNFLGVVFFDHIKHIVFKPEFYDTTLVKDLSFYPDATVELSDSMEHVVKRFHETGNFNLPVLDKGKYVGFVSRANTFSVYRKKLKYFSED